MEKMSFAAFGTTEAPISNKYVISIRGKMDESPTSEASKADKKREYNRNAQRVFRQRRKQHLKELEDAQKEQSSVQSEEIQRLREENIQLLQENQGLRHAYESGSSSPVGINTSPTTVVANPFASAFSAAPTPYVAMPSSLNTAAIAGVMSSLPANLCVIAPHNLAEIRRQLHTIFAQVLDVHVISDARAHLETLAAMAPQLPPPLKPTPTQLQTPHHAFIDLIPSPSLRDRLIGLGASASSFLSQACPIVCEMEDHGELTIWGEDWMNEISWEFSEAVLARWSGWVLGREWGQRANFWRKQRGVPPLPVWEG